MFCVTVCNMHNISLTQMILLRMCNLYDSVLEGEAGRGINVVIFDPLTKSIINSTHFDTYESRKQILQYSIDAVFISCSCLVNNHACTCCAVCSEFAVDWSDILNIA